MQTAREIKSALDNIRYYSGKIKDLAKQQFELDYQAGADKGLNPQPGSLRFDALGAMAAGCSQLDVYCDNIEANLVTAVKQDKLLHTEAGGSNG